MTKGDKGKKINEELVCADALAHCLKSKHKCLNVDVKQETDDPPDFWFTIDNEKFAVEVTSIVKDEDYRKRCRKLKENIKEAAAQQEALAGAYALKITRNPKIPKRNSKEWRDLVQQATSFIQDTRSVASTDERVLLKEVRNRLGIIKLSAEGAAVGLIGPVEVKWGVDIQKELCQILKKAIAKKRERLEKKGVPRECSQIMLLLYDAYGLGDTEDAQNALLKVEGYDWFHSIFWVASFTDRPNELSPQNPGREGAFLYSREKNWCKSPTAD